MVHKIDLDTPIADIIEYVKDNEAITKAFLKANLVVNQYQHPYCSISGGKDSDIMLDIIYRVDRNKKMRWVFFDTGLEYEATKRHLDYLEEKYNITIERIKAIKPIPLTCKEYGQPFLSKQVSKMMRSLQYNNFQWEDGTYEELVEKYPNIKSAISWWTNHREVGNYGYSMFNINYNRFLKEFILQNPPEFNISNICCDYAKKKVNKKYSKENNIDLVITGVRQSEGGVRAARYKSCFDNKKDVGDVSMYRPLFWFRDEDEEIYTNLFGLKHSDCYEIYGLKRTGCVGCPYNRWIMDELQVMENNEPKLAKAAKYVFKDAYDYTQRYRKFVKKQKAIEKEQKKQAKELT